MRPPTRSRASRMMTCRPAPDSSRAAARPAAPAPMTTTSTLFADDLRPRQPAHREDLLVDGVLRRAIAEDPAKVIHLGGDQLVVLGEEADRGVLEVAFGHGDHFRRSRALIAHGFSNGGIEHSNPGDRSERLSLPFSSDAITVRCDAAAEGERLLRRLDRLGTAAAERAMHAVRGRGARKAAKRAILRCRRTDY